MYRIKSIDLFVREITPPRMDFAIGKGKSLFPEWMRLNVEARLMLESRDGRTAFGCSADWPSFGWLDKRPDVDPKQKLRELLQLIIESRTCFLANSEFESPFDCWWNAQEQFYKCDKAKSAVPLCVSFALALIERALIDAVCRLEGNSFFEMLKQSRLGFRPDWIHAELGKFEFASCLPTKPLAEIEIRHTVGLTDPLTNQDLDPSERLDDGLPQTLEDYVKNDGIASFKIKVSGDAAADRLRLQKIWDVIQDSAGSVTLDGNEAFDDAEKLLDYLAMLESLPGLIEKIQFIEQPMNRADTHNENLRPAICEAAKQKPLIIDEADGYIHAFAEAIEIGYLGVSHKNCKGIFKSLANFALCKFRNGNTGTNSLFLSAEDLTSMPLAALQQDFAVVSAMGLANAERNGHHFFYGLKHLTEREKESARAHYPELYRCADHELFLNIRNGRVDVSNLQQPGLGIVEEPDWTSMQPLESWLASFEN